MRNPTLAAAAAALLVAACNGTTAPVGGSYESLPADQVIYGMTHNMTVDGVRSAHLRADTALVFNDSAAIQLRRLSLELYTESGTVRAELTSQGGSLDQNTNRMVARGQVVLQVRGDNAMTLRTEELHYDPNQKVIWSDVQTERVMANGQRNTMNSFRADERMGNFRAEGLRGDAGQIRF
jgi:LPS export ABC transporter protein LptC